MTHESLIVLGAGGQARETTVLAELLGMQVLALVDRERGNPVWGIPVMAERDIAGHKRTALGVGTPRLRSELFHRYVSVCNWPALIHPAATLSRHVSVGDGCMVQAAAVISCDVVLETGCLINYCATVGHDAQVGAFSVVLPGASISGGVELGARALIGAGATILPGVKIGNDSVVGAGAVVIKDVPSDATVVGVPARVMRP